MGAWSAASKMGTDSTISVSMGRSKMCGTYEQLQAV